MRNQTSINEKPNQVLMRNQTGINENQNQVLTPKKQNALQAGRLSPSTGEMSEGQRGS
jgi:hypothetical protein